MNELLLEKTNQLIDEIDNSDMVKELLKTKKTIYNDKELEKQLEEYRALETTDVLLKKRIISNPLVVKYRNLENELYFTVLNINNIFRKITDKKGCNNESN